MSADSECLSSTGFCSDFLRNDLNQVKLILLRKPDKFEIMCNKSVTAVHQTIKPAELTTDHFIFKLKTTLLPAAMSQC